MLLIRELSVSQRRLRQVDNCFKHEDNTLQCESWVVSRREALDDLDRIGAYEFVEDRSSFFSHEFARGKKC